MSRISAHDPLLARLRLRGAAGQKGGAPGGATPGAAAGGSSLEQALASRLSRLDPMRAGAEREAAAVIIETALAHAFGAALLAQPSGRELLSQVQHAMLSAPEVRAALLSLLGRPGRPDPR